MNKAMSGKIAIARLNSTVEVTAYPYHFTAKNAKSLVEAYDVVADCTDNVSVGICKVHCWCLSC